MKSFLVPKNEQIKRMDICKKCSNYKFGICKKCGCIMLLKTKLLHSHCPLDKWTNPVISWGN